jgi:prepilin peptidase CpaA
MTVAPLGPADVVLAGVLVAACATDLRTRRIPNVLTLPAIVLGVVDGVRVTTWWHGLAGVLVAFLLAAPAWRMGGAMRAGDVKLLMAAGAFLGWQGALRGTVFTYLLAFPFGVAVLAWRGRLSNLWRVWAHGEREELTHVAFAPVIALAVVLARCQPWPELG